MKQGSEATHALIIFHVSYGKLLIATWNRLPANGAHPLVPLSIAWGMQCVHGRGQNELFR